MINREDHIHNPLHQIRLEAEILETCGRIPTHGTRSKLCQEDGIPSSQEEDNFDSDDTIVNTSPFQICLFLCIRHDFNSLGEQIVISQVLTW